MRSDWFVRTIFMAASMAMPSADGHAASRASVRLDFPPGYLASKPTATLRKAGTQDDCTSNCTNFDAGYAWARARSFKAEEQCRGRSRAFVEGCMIYVTERRKQNR